MIEPLQRTDEKYEVYRSAAVHCPERWLLYLQPEDRDAVLADHKVRVKREPPIRRRRHKATRPTTAEPDKGITVRVNRRGCRKACKWGWVVLLDGVPQESGQCDTEQAARDEANREADELRAALELTVSG